MEKVAVMPEVDLKGMVGVLVRALGVVARLLVMRARPLVMAPVLVEVTAVAVRQLA